jgi:hypothetical protein
MIGRINVQARFKLSNDPQFAAKLHDIGPSGTLDRR